MKETITQGTVLCAESNPEFLLSQHTEIFVISEGNRTISHNTENRPLCYCVMIDFRTPQGYLEACFQKCYTLMR